MKKRCFAEFLGTFMIVFAPVASSATPQSLGVAAAVSGLAVLIMVYALGPISQAHFNPAVTLAFTSVGRFPRREVLPYVASQLLGGVAAAGVASLVLRPGLGAHIPAALPVGSLVAMELLVTFLLMFVIMAVATDPRVHAAVPPLAIGLTVITCVLFGGPITGASMNPARSFGPGLFNPAALPHLWLYLLVPPAGAILAARTYEWLRDTKPASEKDF